MVKLISAKCPNCGANIEIESQINTILCKYCGSTIIVDGILRIKKRNYLPKDDVDKKCMEISEKLNTILELYIGNKNNMLEMLKGRIGLVNSEKTTSKIAMMKTANTFEDDIYEKPFTYRIGDRTLDHFEYKRDGSIELTYETDEDGFFALEYYGKIQKYTDINELSRVLDEIIEEVKLIFQNNHDISF